MSCSYGPGRYDKQYEVQGIDYPFGFVRWTEKRNLEAFLQLLAKGRIQVESLTTHRFDVAHAADAYDLILGRANEKYLGVLLEYPGGNGKMPATKIHSFHSNGKMPAAGPRVGFIGAGNFAQTYLLPNVKKISGVELVGVANLNGPSAKSVGDKFGFRYCTTDYQEIIADENIDVIFIATRHDLHAPIAIAALRAGKSVFVEKPPALNSEQLRDLMQAYSDAATSAKEHAPRFAVGYNRRHTPLAVEIKKLFENVASPLAVNYRINAGFLDRSHWLHDPQAGGGRIVGELCHFVDLAQYFIGSLPISVYAEALSSANDEPAMQDNVAVLLKFQNGGVAVITYLANGSSKMPKERIEIFGGGVCAAIDNFTGGIYFSASKAQKITKKGKGYFEEVQAFGEGQEVGSSIECFYPSATTFAILESLRTQSPQNVTLP
jgi:polar amino acid transport system substrate-binding protein